MRVKITFHNGYSLVGDLEILKEMLLYDILNDDKKFVTVLRPNGDELHLNKEAVAYIVKEED